MKFNYPYKLYLSALLTSVILSLYAFYDIFIANDASILFSLIYIIFCLPVFYWQYALFSEYKNRFVILDSNSLIIVNKNSRTILQFKDIDRIIETTEPQLFKLKNMIHIFTLNGEKITLSNDMNSFCILKSTLNLLFPKKYSIKKEIKINNIF